MSRLELHGWKERRGNAGVLKRQVFGRRPSGTRRQETDMRYDDCTIISTGSSPHLPGDPPLLEINQTGFLALQRPRVCACRFSAPRAV